MSDRRRSKRRAGWLSRRHVALYPPSVIWAALILLFAVQSWWASFGLAGHREWTFAAFGTVLLQTVLLYMLAALVLPDFAQGKPVDVRAHYFRESRPFFGIALAMLATSFGKEVMFEGRPPEGANLIFHIVFAALFGAAIATRRPGVHLGMAVFAAALFVAYIVLLFTRLC